MLSGIRAHAADTAPIAADAASSVSPPAKSSAPSDGRPDIVRLRNGGMLRGTIDQRLPGDYVVLVTPSGETKRIDWTEITYAGPSEQDTAAVPPVTPNAQAITPSDRVATHAPHPKRPPEHGPVLANAPERPIHPLKIAGLVVGSIGAAAATVALVASAVQSSGERELKSLCGSDRDCADDNPRRLTVDELARARTLNAELDSRTALWNLTLVGSGLAVVTGLILYLAAPDPPKQSAWRWALLASAPKSDRGGVSLVMGF